MRVDAALPANEAALVHGGAGVDRRTAGIVAAAALNELLIQNRLGWNDAVAPGSRLAKLCGRLGSDYEAEREAAYDHAVRLILRRRATWSDLVRLPDALKRCPVETNRLARNGSREADAALETASPRFTEAAPPVPDCPANISPPEENWGTTIQRLYERVAWRSETEHARLDALQISLANGHALTKEDACWLREIWWYAELCDPGPGRNSE